MDIKDVIHVVHDGEQIAKIYVGRFLAWPDPWNDIWNDAG